MLKTNHCYFNFKDRCFQSLCICTLRSLLSMSLIEEILVLLEPLTHRIVDLKSEKEIDLLKLFVTIEVVTLRLSAIISASLL